MIGIFDSGIGGITVVKAFRELLPNYDIIYFGDTARTPYGNKSSDTIIKYTKQDIDFLVSRGAKIIVAACNTASTIITDALRASYDVPIFEVISPAVRLAADVSSKKSIGVIGTRTTINSGVYEKKLLSLNPEIRVYSTPCPMLVPLVEEGWFKRPETVMIVKKYLLSLKVKQIDTLILGCTHYPLLKNIIQRKIGKRVSIIDSSLAAARQVKDFLEKNTHIDENLQKNKGLEIFVSDITAQFEKIAAVTLKKRIKLKHVNK